MGDVMKDKEAFLDSVLVSTLEIEAEKQRRIRELEERTERQSNRILVLGAELKQAKERIEELFTEAEEERSKKVRWQDKAETYEAKIAALESELSDARTQSAYYSKMALESEKAEEFNAGVEAAAVIVERCWPGRESLYARIREEKRPVASGEGGDE